MECSEQLYEIENTRTSAEINDVLCCLLAIIETDDSASPNNHGLAKLPLESLLFCENCTEIRAACANLIIYERREI